MIRIHSFVSARALAAVALAAIGQVALWAAPAWSYPGGTPSYQTDVAPFCSSCHSSLSEDALKGAGERATKELADNKHLAVIQAGEKGYAELSEAERATLVDHIRATDANTKIALEYPPQVEKGATFQVRVLVTGGAGPAIGVGLVDRAHRWFARPASAAGWTVVGAPSIIGPKGPQSDWIAKRPESMGRNITFVNVTGVESNAATGQWAESKVIYNLRAPDKPGVYPLVGVLFYGTEKASPLGYKTNPMGFRQVRGGFTGGSGRVEFSESHVINVK
ncbi:MAG: hypothetical protein ACQGVK_16790 [Myxococcota bacterium]